MSAWLSYLGSVALLLAAPGPTNALLAAGAAQQGTARGALLLAGVAAGYAVGVGAWLLLVGQAANVHPAVPLAAKLIAIAFLLWSAWTMWVAAEPGRAASVITTRQVFLTTLLNPKAMVVAFALIPAAPPLSQAAHVVALCLSAVGIGLIWLALGAWVARRASGLLGRRGLERGTAAVLALFATVLAVQALG